MFFTAASDMMHTTTISQRSSSTCDWIWVTVIPLGVYSALSIVSTTIDCYNFIAAWKLISDTHRMDAALVHSKKKADVQRKKVMEQTLVTRPYEEIFYPKESCCSICLGDFQRHDAVSSVCDLNKERQRLHMKPCTHMFHQKCLAIWLKKHSSCPCCRHEMLPPLDPLVMYHPTALTP